MDDREPTRLAEDGGQDAGLRDDLQAARENVVDYDVVAGLAAFTAAAGGGAAATTAAVKSTSMGWLSWLLGAGAAVAIGAGVYAMSSDDPSPHRPTGDLAVAPAAAPAASEPALSEPAASEAPGAEPDQTPPEPVGERQNVVPDSQSESDERRSAGGPEPGSTKGAEPHVVRPAPEAQPDQNPPTAATATAADSVAEAKLVAEVRSVVESEPARALELLRQAAERFPEGALRPEREGYEVLALIASGREEQARERGTRYLVRHPRGTMAARVRAALGESAVP
jgi:hypothetical protein